VTSAPCGEKWLPRLRREIAWLLLGKLIALIVLWSLFFSPSHRHRIDGAMTADRFALKPGANAPLPQEKPVE